MNRLIKAGCLLLVAGSMANPVQGWASGSYCVCVTKPPSKQLRVDREKYDLGQKVFNEKAALATAVTKPEEQKDQLAALQSLLPKRTAKKKDLTALAGHLSSQQLEALEYYVHQRYGKAK